MLTTQNQKKYGHKKPKKGEVDPVKVYHDTMRNYAKMFTFGYMLWPGCTAAAMGPAALPPNYDPSSRFATSTVEESIDQDARTTCGVLWEVQRTVPASLVPEDGKTGIFYQQMFKIMGEFRSSYQNQLRERVTLLLVPGYDLTSDDVRDIKDHVFRKNSASFKILLGFNSSKEEGSPDRYPLFPPLLVESNPTVNDALGGTFQTPIIRRILVLILFGPQQLAQNRLPPRRIPGCNAANWNIERITPGMIAAVCIGARYLLSPDQEFSPQGKLSKINWEFDFDRYRSFINEFWESQPMVRVVEQLNHDLFGKRTPPPPKNAVEGTPAPVIDKQYNDLWKRMTEGKSNRSLLLFTDYAHPVSRSGASTEASSPR
ncbi:hypothetical protein CPB86DRAFT_283787 [Serendipita vermifera]|nr:hypothetical protein CPB86DRAFT_283787 [Serendipita vermifera]